MKREPTDRATDLRGVSRLTIDAVTGLTDLVEAMHHNVTTASSMAGVAPKGRTRGITGFVYGTIRGVTRLVGGGIDAVLRQLGSLLGESGSSPTREAVLAALNGVLGDYLVESGNPLAIPMRLRHNGRQLELTAEGLAAVAAKSGAPQTRLLVLLHGLCMNDLQWSRQGHDHGAALARDLGYVPLYLHYNSGRHISTNGREFAALMETLVQAWPAPIAELVLVGHSMGGLIARSALHVAHGSGHAWPRLVKKLVFLGTPHHGAPLERGGHWVDIFLGASPYTAPFSRLGKIRSAGVTDLRYGNLLDEDWVGRDRFARSRDHRVPVPLPRGVACYALAATTGAAAGDAKDRLLADGLVPLASALGMHVNPEKSLPIPEANQWIGYKMNHLDLLARPEVYQQIRRWLAPEQLPNEQLP
ncbi:MAG: alpha/beta hydrolase [Betaproteobacteria bacterium]|nr:alpha/beta hydrolase [Betaproteobacteria bacterium]